MPKSFRSKLKRFFELFVVILILLCFQNCGTSGFDTDSNLATKTSSLGLTTRSTSVAQTSMTQTSTQASTSQTSTTQASTTQASTSQTSTSQGSTTQASTTQESVTLDVCGRTPERRQNILSLMDVVVTRLKGEANNPANYPDVLYNIQLQTAAPLQAAINCQDRTMLGKLIELYSIPFNHMQTSSSLGRLWLDSEGHEIVLDSTQFIFAAAKLLNAIAHIPVNQRNDAMLAYMATPASPRVDVIGHLERWLSRKSMWTWADCGFSQTDSMLEYTFPEYVSRKYNKTLNYAAGAPGYCNALSEPEMWVATAALELLDADNVSHDTIGLNPTLKQNLKDYARSATLLFRSRMSFPSACSDGTCAGTVVDVGSWHGHPEYPTSLWPNGGEVADISHARRYAQWIDTIYSKWQFAGAPNDLENMTRSFANQLVFKVYNGSATQPSFANFWNGNNVNYRSFGPSGLSSTYYASGFGFWGRYHSGVDHINKVLLNLIESHATVSNNMMTNGVPPNDYDLLGFYCSLAYAP